MLLLEFSIAFEQCVLNVRTHNSKVSIDFWLVRETFFRTRLLSAWTFPDWRLLVIQLTTLLHLQEVAESVERECVEKEMRN
jgi:hypothetical protein